jgi:hypothetical protein
VTLSVPPARLLVVQLAIPGLPDVTGVVPQPVLPLQVTDPVTSFRFTPRLLTAPFTSPFSPLIVAVNVTDCP